MYCCLHALQHCMSAGSRADLRASREQPLLNRLFSPLPTRRCSCPTCCCAPRAPRGAEVAAVPLQQDPPARTCSLGALASYLTSGPCRSVGGVVMRHHACHACVLARHGHAFTRHCALSCAMTDSAHTRHGGGLSHNRVHGWHGLLYACACITGCGQSTPLDTRTPPVDRRGWRSPGHLALTRKGQSPWGAASRCVHRREVGSKCCWRLGCFDQDPELMPHFRIQSHRKTPCARVSPCLHALAGRPQVDRHHRGLRAAHAPGGGG